MGAQRRAGARPLFVARLSGDIVCCSTCWVGQSRLAARGRVGGALLFASALGLWSRPASADPHTVCVEYDHAGNFFDASPLPFDGEDFGRNDGDFPALRHVARIATVEAQPSLLYGWDVLDENGCAIVRSGGRGRSLSPGSLRSQHARLAHWAPRSTASLFDGRWSGSLGALEADTAPRAE